jgi:phospholipid/cholesterol/gamma-HCH transport system permease protein
MICTGRAGSAFAAEIGTMKVAEEVDALVTMGLDPTRFLIVPKLLALLFVMPILTLFGNLLGVLGGFVVGTLSLDIPTSAYLLRTAGAIAPFDLVEGLTKSAVFALLIAGVGCLRGFEARNSAQAVGRATTSAVVSGIFLVIVADTLLTILFSRFRG